MPPTPARDVADLNFVLACLKEDDALKKRAQRHARASGQPDVPFAVGIELLLWCRKHGESYLDFVERCVIAFDVERPDVLLAAAHALEEEGVRSPFDAVHLAEALVRNVRLVTADEPLWRTRYPMARY
jgi:hypothetical protein